MRAVTKLMLMLVQEYFLSFTFTNIIKLYLYIRNLTVSKCYEHGHRIALYCYIVFFGGGLCEMGEVTLEEQNRVHSHGADICSVNTPCGLLAGLFNFAFGVVFGLLSGRRIKAPILAYM